jgi:hypothetical protein
MNVAARIGGFGLILAVVFATAAFAGSKLDPSVDESDEHAGETEMETASDHATQPAPEAAPGPASLPGLAVADGGYRLVPERTTFTAGASGRFRFRIADYQGETVREFELEHERRMHLIVVRRDFQGFQHLHPRQLEDGSWETRVDLGEGGVYRAFADFATGGSSSTLGTDLFVSGRFEPRPIPAPATSDDAGGGYQVTLESPPLRGGETGQLRFTVTRDGRPVDSVEPYLGADGHLVALREHDQAYLHTHPEGEAGGPGPIVFDVEYPSQGRYRIFLQFKHRGEVRTVSFTQEVGAAEAEAEGTEEAEGATDGEH